MDLGESLLRALCPAQGRALPGFRPGFRDSRSSGPYSPLSLGLRPNNCSLTISDLHLTPSREVRNASPPHVPCRTATPPTCRADTFRVSYRGVLGV